MVYQIYGMVRYVVGTWVREATMQNAAARVPDGMVPSVPINTINTNTSCLR